MKAMQPAKWNHREAVRRFTDTVKKQNREIREWRRTAYNLGDEIKKMREASQPLTDGSLYKGLMRLGGRLGHVDTGLKGVLEVLGAIGIKESGHVMDMLSVVEGAVKELGYQVRDVRSYVYIYAGRCAPNDADRQTARGCAGLPTEPKAGAA